MSRPPRAFISYRVEDVLAVAGTLARELERVFSSGTVFLDHSSLEAGEPWPERLREEVRTADVVLVLIGPRWFTLQGSHGVRRLDDPEDWVRLEIENALATDRMIIPVLVDGAARLEKLAFRTIPQIETLAERQTIALSTKQWDATFDALVNRLVALGFRRADPTRAPEAQPAVKPFRSTIPARGNAPFVGREELLGQLQACLADAASQQFVVLHGPPGVGKSELAREYARRSLSQYPGGAFYVSVRESGPPVDLATIGRTVLGLSQPADLTLRDQCIRTLLSLGTESFLLIYDNAAGPDNVEDWLPPAGAGGHVIVTSTWERWDARWQCVPVSPMSDLEAGRLVQEIAGTSTSTEARTVIRFADGLPAQLVPAAQMLRVSIARHQPPRQLAEIMAETRESFAAPWSHLPPAGRLLLVAAAQFHPDRVSRGILEDAFSTIGFTKAQFDTALDSCLDLSMMTGESPLRIHSLLARYVQARANEVDSEQLRGARHALQARFMQAARAVIVRPTEAAGVATLTTFSIDPTRWGSEQEADGLGMDPTVVGDALVEIGHFAEARPWFERAVAEAERGDEHGRVDHESFSASLHRLGFCLWSLGKFTEARPWFERAVTEAEHGDVNGRVDHESLGRSLNQVGLCLSPLGRFAEARPWYERAVAEKEQGDLHGRVDHESLGRSLHEVGMCLSSLGQFVEARSWYERAVAEKERGDIHGRINHASLGRSLHQVGYCLWSLGQFAEARPWYERAVAEARQGDVHGRVDQSSLGSSLHSVGFCLFSLGQFAEARPWFERAVAKKEQADVHGRIDHAGLGRSLHEVGACLSSLGQFAEAQPWYERAVAEAEQGDVHGRVDHASLGRSLHQVGYCLSSLGQFTEARPWFGRAVAAKEQGDVHGRMDHASLGTSLHAVGLCLSSLGQLAEARPWFERAIAEKERGDVHGRVDHESLASSREALRDSQAAPSGRGATNTKPPD